MLHTLLHPRNILLLHQQTEPKYQNCSHLLLKRYREMRKRVMRRCEKSVVKNQFEKIDGLI